MRQTAEVAEETTSETETGKETTDSLLDKVLGIVPPLLNVQETTSRVANKELEMPREYGALHAVKLLGKDKVLANKLLGNFEG